MATAVATACLTGSALGAQTPDVTTLDLADEFQYYGQSGGIHGYAFATTACNAGDANLSWDGGSPAHPVIAMNLYRLKDGRFEQIGMSWTVHGFCAVADLSCGSCSPTGCRTLGVECATRHWATLNGNPRGPRSEVDAISGTNVSPPIQTPTGPSPIRGRLQVANADIDPAQNPGARYFAEAIHVAADDRQAGNAANDAGWREIQVTSASNLDPLGATTPGQPAIFAWKAAVPSVVVRELAVTDEGGPGIYGLMYLAYHVSDNGDGTWRYEYALQNLSSSRGVHAFRVGIPPSANVTDVAFHDVDHHSGEPYDPTDWTLATVNCRMSWQGVEFAVDPDANALRWGTLYNFSFSCDRPPVHALGEVALFEPGPDATLEVALLAPSEPCTGVLPSEPVVEAQFVHKPVPEAWRADEVAWVGDVDPRNKIDDLIDASTESTFDVFVNYSRCTDAGDVAYLEGLSGTSQVVMDCKYIPTIAVEGITKAELDEVASDPDVAFIELVGELQLALDVALPTIGVTAGGTHGGYVDQLTDPNDGSDIHGHGVNIAIVDTGVDNFHAAFAGTPWIAGYDAVTDTAYNGASGLPLDCDGHGTYMASVALGQATANSGRGVAPAAGLIDVRITQDPLECDVSPLRLMDALEWLYDNRDVLPVHVISMSLAGLKAFGRTRAVPSLVNRGAALGIVMVTSSGNMPDQTELTLPGSSVRAITVSGSNDRATADHMDDTLWANSVGGPLPDDGDADPWDELKPDVAAPAFEIEGALANTGDQATVGSGTSLAAAMVAGVAALILEVRPDLDAGSVKDLILRTAEPKGHPTRPNVHPTWNKDWGHGLVNAYGAVDELIGTTAVDLTFASHPPPIPWASPDIVLSHYPPDADKLNSITARLDNRSGVTVEDVTIEFGVHVFSKRVDREVFDPIATVVRDLPPGRTDVWVPWKPSRKRRKKHQCVQVEIVYAFDSDHANDFARHNFSVSRSPIRFDVENSLTAGPSDIELEVACVEGDAANWDISLSPPCVTLGPADCPVEVELLATPRNVLPDGASIVTHVSARTGSSLVGGVSVLTRKKDCNGNTVDDYVDIVSGTSLDLDEDGVPDECPPACNCSPFAFCTTGSPCDNGAGLAGCVNSTGKGARLDASGSSSLAYDDLVLTATDLPPGQPALLVAGPRAGLGISQLLGDGSWWIGSTVLQEIDPATGAATGRNRLSLQGVQRLGARTATAQGTATWGPGLAASVPVPGTPVPVGTVPSGGWSPGETRAFQVIYRDPSGPCGRGFNISSGVLVELVP